jgi:hypothetical protein
MSKKPSRDSFAFRITTNESGSSENSGNSALIMTKESAYSKLILIIQKFCGVTEILDQFFSILPKCCARSRNSEIGVLNHDERKCTLQKFWNRCFDPDERKPTFQKIWRRYLIIQKFCGGPEILDDPTEMMCTFQKIWTKCLGSYRTKVGVPEILESVF